MKTTLLTMALALLATPVLAHEDYGDHNWSEHVIQRLDEQLDLSDEQHSQVEALVKEQFEKRQALRTESDNRMKEILNDEQKAKFEHMKAERKTRWQKMHEQWKAQNTAQ